MHRRRVAVLGSSVLPVTVLEGRAVPGLPPRLYVPRGPACLPEDAAAWAATLADLEALAAGRGAAAIVVEPPCWAEELPVLRRHLDLTGWAPTPTLQPAHTAVVDLRGGEAAVLSRMRPKGRYNARLAERRGVVAGRAAGADAAEVLARLCAATARRQGIHQPDSAHLVRVLAAVPGAAVYLASVAGEPVAGALVAAFGGESVYLYGGSSGRHRELQPAALLHLAVIRDAVAAGSSVYDLWGIPPGSAPDHPWHGLRQFKLSLGGVERSLAGAFLRVRRPGAQRLEAAALRGRARLRRARLRRAG